MNPDRKATALGIAAAALLAANIDWARAVNGDHGELSKAAGAVVVGLLGWVTNKSK